MYYCNSCGEVGDGRFCRMCGAPLSSLADQSGTVQLASVAATQVTGAGTGTGIGSEFDGLFRSEDGSHTPFEQTRMLQQIPGAEIGHPGPYPGQFFNIHVMASDAQGNLYVGEGGGRVQKFVYKGMAN